MYPRRSKDGGHTSQIMDQSFLLKQKDIEINRNRNNKLLNDLELLSAREKAFEQDLLHARQVNIELKREIRHSTSSSPEEIGRLKDELKSLREANEVLRNQVQGCMYKTQNKRREVLEKENERLKQKLQNLKCEWKDTMKEIKGSI